MLYLTPIVRFAKEFAHVVGTVIQKGTCCRAEEAVETGTAEVPAEVLAPAQEMPDEIAGMMQVQHSAL